MMQYQMCGMTKPATMLTYRKLKNINHTEVLFAPCVHFGSIFDSDFV